MCPKCLSAKITSRRLTHRDVTHAHKLRSRSGCHELRRHHLWRHLFGTCFAAQWPELKPRCRQDNDMMFLLPMLNLLVLEGWESPFLCPSAMLGTLLQGGQDLVAPFHSAWETSGEEVSLCLPMPWPIRCRAALCGGEETT